ncbi:hypothetical protein DERF_014192 [Dermatophagoides farinae]|uniref:Uncharacterized protein n=1 Tax=Dermatophagoides farinae TaxID=6954 RepID=A0A922HMG1_DERFA|nr:hypothetical protein DERF_014192 [Dermatophagoides farinae]
MISSSSSIMKTTATMISNKQKQQQQQRQPDVTIDFDVSVIPCIQGLLYSKINSCCYLHCNVPTLFATRHGNIIVSPTIDVLSIGSISKRCGGNRPVK